MFQSRTRLIHAKLSEAASEESKRKCSAVRECKLGTMERLRVGPGSSTTLPFEETATENTLTDIVGESSTSETTLHLLQPMQPLGWNGIKTWRQNEDAASRKGRKRKLQKCERKRNVAKVKRNKGKAYICAKGTHINAQSMKTGCESKCRYQCNQIQYHKRSQIFEKYWSLGDVNRQRQNVNYEYHFEVDGLKYGVCKKFFMDTLNVGDKMIRNTVKKTCDGVVEEDMRGKHSYHPTIDPTTTADIRTHINSIPRIESHYLRKQTSREFISGGKTLADLHRDYVKECQEQGRSHGTEYKEHRKEIELSLTDKAKGSDLAKHGKFVTACFYLQAILPTPCGDVFAFYYKRRLSVLNFTIYYLGRNIEHCYVWHEGAGRRGLNEVASCLLQFLQIYRVGDYVCFYSDNCAGQNKNKFIVALYLYAVYVHDIESITHKFLVTGHTQNEGEHLHYLTEKQKKPVLKSDDPLKVTEIDTQDFMDFKPLSKFYGTNYLVNADKEKISWQNIRGIKAEKEKPFQFSYKTSSKTLLARKVTRGRPSMSKLSHVYTSLPGVTKVKRKDLLSLRETRIIKSHHQSFYSNLAVVAANEKCNVDPSDSE
ncbi:hypothetical protein PR048_010014 [Dryococelus australis]|uniref:DUF7869 domain-containing protein n=1 Tax=Dryococelus australis TaxID=614101 RepID=A0ABQ9I1I8_9NEOP|nr:hypothetical protein PR048_010014 [Dryococelus australis]